MTRNALLIGNSDGIGLETTRLLLARGYTVVGLSRSPSPITHERYTHQVVDVTSPEYRPALTAALARSKELHLGIYFAGIGDELNFENLAFETKVFEVNVQGAVVATEVVLGQMLRQGHGHFIGLGSIADSLISAEAPSYAASKAAVSRYWDGLALALSKKNSSRLIHLTNVRLGFVNTKMAKGSFRPFQMSVHDAARFVMGVVDRPRIRATRPWGMGIAAWMLGAAIRVQLLFAE